MNIRYEHSVDDSMDQAQGIVVNNLKIGTYGIISENFIKKQNLQFCGIPD